MNLVLSDRPLGLTENVLGSDTKVVDLTTKKIANCMGCFGCWVRTPGKCVIRDDATEIYPLIAKSQNVIYVSRVVYGGYDSTMKRMLERAIPIQQAFIRLHNGETHHVQRDVEAKNAVIVAYGANDEKEQELFRKIVERNANNMNFASYKVIFISEDKVDETVMKEAEKWKSA